MELWVPKPPSLPVHCSVNYPKWGCSRKPIKHLRTHGKKREGEREREREREREKERVKVEC